MVSDGTEPIKAVERSFLVLSALQELQEAGVTELANHLDIPASSVNDHLITLRKYNYVIKSDNKYHLGLRFLEIGDSSRNRTRLYKKSRREINHLAERTGEVAHLSVKENYDGVIIYEAEGKNSVALDTHVGRRMTLHNTALGKAMLAHMSNPEIEDVLSHQGMPKETNSTITDREELFKQLQAIRDRGYALSTEERLEGLGCISAPINQSGSSPYGAVSVCVPMTRFETQQCRDEIPDLVCQTANVIELEVKYS